MRSKILFLVLFTGIFLQHSAVASLIVTYGGDWNFYVKWELEHDGSSSSNDASGTTSPFVLDSGTVNGAHAQGEALAPAGVPTLPILKDGPDLKGLAEVDAAASTVNQVAASATIQATNSITFLDPALNPLDPIPNLELRLHLLGNLSGTSSGDPWSAYVTGRVRAEALGQTYEEAYESSIEDATGNQFQAIDETFGEGSPLPVLNGVPYNLFAELVTTAQASGTATATSDFSGNSLQFGFAQVPEAGTWLLLLVGWCGWVGWKRWPRG